MKLNEGKQPILKILKVNHQKDKIGIIIKDPFSINTLRENHRS